MQGRRKHYQRALPQRIRAGCDLLKSGWCHITDLCHSAFARVATGQNANGVPLIILCHSAFARVATCYSKSCSLNFGFATAHSRGLRRSTLCPKVGAKSLPQRIRAGCDSMAGCPPNLKIVCHSAFARVATAEKQCSALRICCEKVDSFSSVGESGLALTIFPFSFAAKATYVAINDSFGRAIDRFFGANRTGISVNYDFAEHPCL